MEMLMRPTLKNGLYSPYKKHSLYCTDVQYSKNSHKAISRAVLNISETVWAVFCFLFFSNHFYCFILTENFRASTNSATSAGLLPLYLFVCEGKSNAPNRTIRDPV